MTFLSDIGENSALYERRKCIRSLNTLIAAASIFETLFNKRTIGQRDETTSSILVDTFERDFPFSTDDVNLRILK